MTTTNINSNVFLEMGDQVIQVPDPKDVKYDNINPEIYMQRMATVSTPSEVIRDLFKGFFLFGPDSKVHEAQQIRHMTFAGFFGGLLFGGILRSPDIHAEYQRKHNAAVFDNKHVGNRHFWDTLISGVARRGLKVGVGTGLLAAAAGFIGYGSVAVRNKVYLPDFLIGFTTLGAVTRMWIGLRGVVAGGTLGLMAGLFGYGFAKAAEISTGYSVAQMRYIHHQDWLAKREAKHRYLLKLQEENHMQALMTGELD